MILLSNTAASQVSGGTPPPCSADQVLFLENCTSPLGYLYVCGMIGFGAATIIAGICGCDGNTRIGRAALWVGPLIGVAVGIDSML